MEVKRPLGDDRLRLLETIRFRRGEAAEVRRALERIEPRTVAIDLTPDLLRQVTAHARHDMGIEVRRIDEIWTNCLAAFADVDPYAEYVAAARHVVEHDLRFVALNRDGTDISRRKRRKLEKDLRSHPIEAEDVREVAMAFRGRLYDRGVLKRIEAEEEQMADVLFEHLDPPTAAIVPYPSSEEISVRVRTLAEEAEAEAAAEAGG